VIAATPRAITIAEDETGAILALVNQALRERFHGRYIASYNLSGAAIRKYDHTSHVTTTIRPR